jgi:2-polyprenyl-6-methoxyphenol hydroxylase-like FAD-dependent oxidoreductase
MKYTDVAIIGGGLAGSTAAAMLGRASIATVLIDPHPTYPFDFRVEN